MKRLASFGLIFAICLLSAASQVYVRRGNLWVTSLEKNCESSLLLFRDGTVIVLTEYLADRVVVPWGYVFRNRSPKDLIVVIHNHLGLGRWSDADKCMYYRLRTEGFKGAFLLRLGNGDVIQLED